MPQLPEFFIKELQTFCANIFEHFRLGLFCNFSLEKLLFSHLKIGLLFAYIVTPNAKTFHIPVFGGSALFLSFQKVFKCYLSIEKILNLFFRTFGSPLNYHCPFNIYSCPSKLWCSCSPPCCPWGKNEKSRIIFSSK